MHVANKKPTAIKQPVRVTETKYEIWYGQPISLGEINKDRGNWYTQDGMRFVSSRDAMEYLIRIRDAREQVASKPIAAQVQALEAKLAPAKSSAPVSTKPAAKPTRVVKAVATKQKITIPAQVPVMQNHPAFQEFLEFVEYRNSNKNRTRTPDQWGNK